MSKKVIAIILCLGLIFSLSATAFASENDMQPPAGFQNGERPSGDFTPPENFTPSGDFTPPEGGFPQQNSELKNQGGNAGVPAFDATKEGNSESAGNSDIKEQTSSGGATFNGQIPEGMEEIFENMQMNPNAENTQNVTEVGLKGFVKTYSTPIASVILLIFGFIFVIFYKRKRY